MKTIQIQGFDTSGTYMTNDTDLAIISEIESKFGSNACFFIDEEKSTGKREVGRVERRLLSGVNEVIEAEVCLNIS